MMMDVLLPFMAWMEGWVEEFWVLHCSYFSKNSLGLIVVIIVIILVVITKELGILWNCLPYKMRIIFYYSPAYRTTKNLACKNFSFVLHFSRISYSISK